MPLFNSIVIVTLLPIQYYFLICFSLCLSLYLSLSLSISQWERISMLGINGRAYWLYPVYALKAGRYQLSMRANSLHDAEIRWVVNSVPVQGYMQWNNTRGWDITLKPIKIVLNKGPNVIRLQPGLPSWIAQNTTFFNIQVRNKNMRSFCEISICVCVRVWRNMTSPLFS